MTEGRLSGGIHLHQADAYLFVQSFLIWWTYLSIFMINWTKYIHDVCAHENRN